MFRKIFWINVGLFIIILLLAYNLNMIWTQVLTQIKSPSTKIDFSKKVEASVLVDEDELDYVPASRMSYSAIVEKYLFRPQREEWQPPPPPEEEEVDLKQSSPYPQYPGQVQEQEAKKPELYGIIIIGESKSYAIMQGWKRGEAKERTRKIRLGNGQIRELPLPPPPQRNVPPGVAQQQRRINPTPQPPLAPPLQRKIPNLPGRPGYPPGSLSFPPVQRFPGMTRR